MGPSPLRAAPNEVSLHRPLIPTQGQVQLSPSTGPSCPKRELQNEAVPTQGPGRDRYGLSPREEEEEEDGLAGCAAQEPELATRPREGFGGPKETRLPARPRCCRASEAWLEPAAAVLLYLCQGKGAGVSGRCWRCSRTTLRFYGRPGTGRALVRSS